MARNLVVVIGDIDRCVEAAAARLCAPVRITVDADVRRVAVHSNNLYTAGQLRRFGVTVTERVPMAVRLSDANARYLAADPFRGVRRAGRRGRP